MTVSYGIEKLGNLVLPVKYKQPFTETNSVMNR